ncbi:MAG TPA: 30S ribosome-binding factor RbfA [Fibrobacteraceae bacterium]|nr:30S ribosome-binding factor RbfA [Fibrobacteraceae bacterium]
MTRRTDRLGELFREELSRLIQQGLKDPRIGLATISRVEVTEDLSYAKVFTSVLGSEKERTDTIIGLNRSAGYLRGVLFKSIRIRQMPHLQFVLDEGLDHSLRVQQILNEIHLAEASKDKGSDSDPPN